MSRVRLRGIRDRTEDALKVLRAKLWEREEQKRLVEEKSIRGAYKTPGWGNQIRSYVLHPYHMVKDVRTELETNNTDRGSRR